MYQGVTDLQSDHASTPASALDERAHAMLHTCSLRAQPEYVVWLLACL
jgi:hypothetical protein